MYVVEIAGFERFWNITSIAYKGVGMWKEGGEGGCRRVGGLQFLKDRGS